ncbi:MAG TPA: ATP-binding cassette domain-containing protein [Bacteroidales bacterium]|nr:ATP-binding cassette domain-containing protein [Bacteroidales bacterium]
MEFFKAVNVSKQFQHHVALDRVSISLPKQSIYGLLGPNGAGKTTFIRIINQITAPDSGELFFEGEKLRPRHITRIGYLPEERGLYKKMKVGEQAIYLAQLKGIPRHEAIKKLKHWFEKFDILNWWDKKVEELSKGMAQKVQFIVTILHKPDLLIFDEPFSGFDPINVNLLKDEILTLRKNGSTVIFSTHNMASVEELCDHIALIDNAKKILEGNVKEIKNTYRTNTYRYVVRNMSDHPQTILPNGIQLLESTQDENLTTLILQLQHNDKPNELTSKILQYGELTMMEEVLPTMNEVFIRKITEIKK